MNRLLLAMIVASAAPQAMAQSQGVRETALARIPKARLVAADPELVRAVRIQNAARESMDEVRRKDEEWRANPGYPLRKELSANSCSRRLRELTSDDPFVAEVILMDAQGANVCSSRETTDYWPGDEAKYQRTFAADKELLVEEPAFDASSGAYAIQLTTLVLDGKSKIGALTLTLRVRKEDVTKAAVPR